MRFDLQEHDGITTVRLTHSGFASAGSRARHQEQARRSCPGCKATPKANRSVFALSLAPRPKAGEYEIGIAVALSIRSHAVRRRLAHRRRAVGAVGARGAIRIVRASRRGRRAALARHGVRAYAASEKSGPRFIWRPDTGTIITDGGFDLPERDAFRNSPMVHVSETGTALRRRIGDADCPMDFPVLTTCATKASPIMSARRCALPTARFMPRRGRRGAGRLLRRDIALIGSIVAPLARVAEIRAYYRAAGKLLETYVGKKAGDRVLAGHIRRGDTEDDPRRDLAVRHARLHQARGPAAAAIRGRLCSIAISIARCRRSSSMAARC